MPAHADNTAQTKTAGPAAAAHEMAEAPGALAVAGPGGAARAEMQDMADRSPIVQNQKALQRIADNYTAKTIAQPVQRKQNNTGLPDNLKAGIEHISGLAMDNVKVHYNSPKPAQLQAYAYAQGTDIHLAPGQEQHLPHEAWHVVQQAQGRVQPTMQMKGRVNINDDKALEHEADVMGAKATAWTNDVPVQMVAVRPLAYRQPALVIQRVELTKEENTRLEKYIEDLDHYLDVLSFSSSIPPRLHKDFIGLLENTEELVYKTHDEQDAKDMTTIAIIDEQMSALAKMMDEAKGIAARDRAATTPGADRPPADIRNMKLDTAKTRAMAGAQTTHELIDNTRDPAENAEHLRSLTDVRFYVWGKSAMGQGDTAFIVRTVHLLKSIGLNAIGVKEDAAAHDVSKSFERVMDFITPKAMIEEARPNDCIIEGPLSDPVGNGHRTALERLAFQKQKDYKAFKNLRLYEYGTLDHRGGVQIRQPSEDNIVNYVADPQHAFLGMGHGEIGAFYNSSQTRPSMSLPEALKAHAATSQSASVIAEAMIQRPGAGIFLGYANARDGVIKWLQAVHMAMEKDPRGPTIVIGIFGQLKDPQTKFEVRPTADLHIVNAKGKPSEQATNSFLATGSSDCSVILTNNVPAPVMAALQAVAQPFTLTTGNYSLSEAVENSHLPVYETLNFNAGVSSALIWQVQNAIKKLDIEPALGKAVLALVSAGPDNLKSQVDNIRLVMQHRHEMKLIMQVVKANTSVASNLIARLSALYPDQASGGSKQE